MKPFNRKKLKIVVRIVIVLLLVLCLIVPLFIPAFAATTLSFGTREFQSAIRVSYEKNNESRHSSETASSEISPSGSIITLSASSYCNIPYSNAYFPQNSILHGSISVYFTNITNRTVTLDVMTTGSVISSLSSSRQTINIGPGQVLSFTVQTTDSEAISQRNTNITLSGTVKVISWSVNDNLADPSLPSAPSAQGPSSAGSEWKSGWNNILSLAKAIGMPLCVLSAVAGGLMMFAPTIVGGDSPERLIAKGKAVIITAVIALICLLLLPTVIRAAIALFGDTRFFEVWTPPSTPSSRPH